MEGRLWRFFKRGWGWGRLFYEGKLFVGTMATTLLRYTGTSNALNCTVPYKVIVLVFPAKKCEVSASFPDTFCNTRTAANCHKVHTFEWALNDD